MNKTRFYTVLFTFALILLGYGAIAQNIAINPTGAAPDNSAMLDVSATNRGILVPRLTVVQRNAITNPATGLLIFQTNSDSGFYYNSGTAAVPNWSRLLVKNEPITSISDLDGDTKVEVEQNADEDLIRFGVNGTEFFRIDSARFEVLNTRNNIFIGQNSGSVFSFSNVVAEPNIGIGTSSLELLTNGRKNVAVGHEALQNTTVGTDNTAVGQAAGRSNTDGVSNTAIGAYALSQNTTGTQNTSIGRYSLFRLDGGSENTVIGEFSAPLMTSGDANTIIGQNAFENNTGSSQNTIIGVGAGRNNLTGGSNVFLGFLAGANELGSNKLYIENSNSSTPLIYGDFANDSLIINGAFSINRNYTFPATSPTNSGDVLQYNGTNLTWAPGGGTPNLSAVLGAGSDAGNDSILNLTTLSIGSSRIPRASIEVDSILTIHGNINGLSSFGSNFFNDGTDLRYLNNGTADGYVSTSGISGIFHWPSGVANAILPSDPASFIRLEDSAVVINGDPSNFEINLKGIVGVDSIRVNGLYSFPNTAPAVGEVLQYDGTNLNWASFSGDDLGNHTATTNIELGTNYLSGDGDNEGVFVAANGSVGIGTNNSIGGTQLLINGLTQFGENGTSGALSIYSEQGVTDRTLRIRPSSSMTQNVTLTMPADDGVLNQVLTTDGNGDLTWNYVSALFGGDNDWVDATGSRVYNLTDNIGIGTSTINSKLHLHGGAVDSTGILLTNNTSGLTATDGFELSYKGTEGGVIKVLENQDLHFYTNNIEGMTLDAAGNLGVGTNSPNGKLEVAGDGSLIGGLYVSGTTAATVGTSIYLNGANQDWTITGTNNLSGAGADKFVIRDYTNAADRMAIDNAGNVGIGTTNPNRRLHIHATSGAGNLQFTSASTGITTTDGFSISNDGSTLLTMWQHENADWNFVTHTGTTAMTIDPTANVGIGTTIPSSELEVVGDIEIPAANDYTYSTAKTHYQSYAPTTFNSLLPDQYGYGTNAAADYYAYFRSGGSAFGYATVAVNLPDGARVTELEGWIYDNLATNPVRVTLLRQALGASTVATMAEVESTTANATTLVQNLTDNTIFNAVIDNENYAYFLFFTGRQNSSDTRLYGTKITYTVTEAD